MSNITKIKCFITLIENYNNEVFILKLSPTRRLPNFKPGQFLHLALDPFDPSGGFWPESRVFSIASAPFESEITVAYAVKGKFTERMKNELSLGKEVWIKLPYGHFTLSATQNEEVILVAGGTGITPFISFISMELKKPNGIPMKLVYGVKKPEVLLFKDLLIDAMKSIKGFQLSVFCEERADNIVGFSVNEGIITLDSILGIAQNPLNANYYLSGPIEMIQTFKIGLTEKGVDFKKIHIDEWE